MEIRKRILLFHFFLFFFLFVGDHHLATEFVTASTATTETSEAYSSRWIQEQINGSVNVCADILGEKWKNDSNKQLHPNATLNVCVPRKLAFHEFVDVNKDGILETGFSIAIFCLALQELPLKIRPVFKPSNSKDYTDTVMQLQGKDCEAVAGDITITPDRTQYADFTIPYMSSEIYMLVPTIGKTSNQPLMTLFRPFKMRLWLTIIFASIFIGVAIVILEYRVGNPEFNVPFYQKLVMITWFPVSTFFFHEGRIHNKCSKFVLVIWLTMIFIVMQIFTACLSSWLTVNQLQPLVPKKPLSIGYQGGSCVEDFARNYVQYYSSTKTKPRLQGLSSMDDYKSALDNGTVDAIFEELPYIDIFIAKYGDTYKKVGPKAYEPGLAFAFSHGSHLQQEFSRAVVNVTASPDMTHMKINFFGIQIPVDQTKQDDSFPQSLDVHSFFLLFIFMGLATIIAIISSEISIRRTTAQISPDLSRHA